jgi:hypothetical protein
MKIAQSQAIIHEGSGRRDRFNSEEAKAVWLSDPERS